MVSPDLSMTASLRKWLFHILVLLGLAVLGFWAVGIAFGDAAGARPEPGERLIRYDPGWARRTG